jgi:hypothetical protein
MPTILREKGFRFFFYTRGEINEPIHIHVEKGEGYGKIWLEPEFAIAYLEGFTRAEERDIVRIARSNIESFKREWHEYFNQ